VQRIVLLGDMMSNHEKHDKMLEGVLHEFQVKGIQNYPFKSETNSRCNRYKERQNCDD
jgi:hypothetical protein